VPFAFPDHVLAVVPDGLGLGPVTVTLARGGTPAGTASFTVEAPAVPRVDSVEPTTLAPGAIAVVRGTGLGTPLDEVTVTFGGAPADGVLALEDVLFAGVPADAASGGLVVTVGDAASAPFPVVVGSLPAPSVLTVRPAAASPGSLVLLEGSDLAVLGDATTVAFAGVPAALFRVTPEAVTAVVPAGALDGDVVVSVGGRASAGLAFDVVPRGPPTIDAAAPDPVAPGGLLRLRGTDLADLSAWVPGALPPFPPFGDLEVTVGGAVAWLAWPTPEGLEAIVPAAAPTGLTTVVVRRSGVSSAAFPLTVAAP
jgi:hypothetical protein